MQLPSLKKIIHLKNNLNNRLLSYTFLLIAVSLSFILLFNACSKDKTKARERAVKAWGNEDYETAAKEFEHYLEVYPTGDESLDARFQLANVYYLHLKRYEEARAQYSEFINQSPSHPNVHLARERLAEVLIELGRLYEAIAEYENLSPQDEQERRRIRLKIAELYYDQKNYSQALTEYEKVITGDYDEYTEQALLREASILHRTRNQYKQALPLYQRIASETDIQKVRVMAIKDVAECQAEMLDIEAAIKTLRSIDEPSEQAYISKRISELESRKHQAAEARNAMQQEK
jgi:tetratricopeptide (TPR) repeat protein